ncbi:hypothetical protein DIPPA_15828 [Diplonema papillatum]|nr:hypothetical protein DIPPA_15828 [Diplonema papillatum]
MIRVADYRKTSLSATHRPVREQDTRPDDDLGEEKPATGEYKSTFFMTEPAAHHAAGALGKPPSIASERLDSREAPGGALKSPWNLPVSHPHTEHAPNDSSNKADWFSINPPDAASESADDPTMPSNWNTVNAELNQLLGSPATLISSPPRGFDASSTAGRSITHNGPQPNLRSAYRELKHALSHPLTNPVAPHLVPRGPTRRKRTTTTTSQHVGSPSAHSNLPPLR